MIRHGPQPKALIRAVVLLVAAVVVGGCASYHQTHYVDSGAYYRSAGDYGGYTGGYSRARYAASNPVVYPYWSIDYFYFSRHYHPYSVYVGYREPLYYPYPGWALGYYRPPHARHSAGYGFGYPWHGFGHRYPRFSLGFFARHDPYRRDYRHGGYRRGRDGRHGDHPIRHIDRRLAELQHRRVDPSRRALLTRRGGGPAIRAGGPAWSAAGTVSPRTGRQDAARQHSRTQLLQTRDSGSLRARSTQSRPDERRRLRWRDGSREVSRQASRRTELRRGTTRRAGAENRSGRERAMQGGTPTATLRGRVIVNNRGDRRSIEPRRGERPAVRVGTRSIRQRAARQGDGDANRGRRTARSAPDAPRSRGSLIRRARPAPHRDSRAPRPDRQRTAPTRTTRANSPPPQRATRGASRRSSSSDGHGDGGGASSRRDRLRSRSDGRRRR